MTPVEQVEIWANAYYNGTPMVDDATYDAFCKANNLEAGLQGDELKGNREPKYKHDLTTGTLAKAEDLEDERFDRWQSRIKGEAVNISMKVDGSGLELVFEDGHFKQAITRGNGFEGLDRTDTVKEILKADKNNGCSKWPLERNGKQFTGSVRGEMVMYKEDFESNFANQYANGRNLVAGMMNRKFSDMTAEDKSNLQYVHFIAYDAMDKNGDFTTQTELMRWLEGFFEVPSWETIPAVDKSRISEWRDKVRMMAYDCDGVVIKADVIDRADRQERTPSRDIAVKPANVVAVSVVRDIVWDQSGSYLSPVAVIDPTKILGVTVTRVSLANLNVMKNLGIEIGKTVSVTRRGDVIPHIMAVLD